MRYRMFSSIPGLYPLDPAAIFPAVVTTKNVSWASPNVPWGGKITLQLRIVALDIAAMLSLADGRGSFSKTGYSVSKNKSIYSYDEINSWHPSELHILVSSRRRVLDSRMPGKNLPFRIRHMG